MFLYAKVTFGLVDILYDLEEIRDELKVPPESLDAAQDSKNNDRLKAHADFFERYGRILERINRQHPVQRDKVRKLLGWVGCSPTPMTVREIEQALIVSRKGKEGSGIVVGPLNLHRICGPIIEVVDDCVQFVHFTVKE